MSRWLQVPLSEVAFVNSGTGFPIRYQGQTEGEFPFLKVSDMNLPGNEVAIQVWNNAVNEGVRRELKANVFPRGSVIFPKIGAAIATNKKRLLTRPSCADNNVMAVTVKDDRLDSDFLFYIFLHKDLSQFASDSNPPSIRKSDVEEWAIPLPPIGEQRRIVDILRRADGIHRLRKQAIQTARELIPALFVDMFGDPVTNPKGWPVQPIGDLVEMVSGATPSKKRPDFWGGDVPWVSPKDMKVEDISNSEDHLAELALSETNIKVIPAVSVLVVVRGMILAHTVPIRINSVPVTINQDMKALVPKKVRASYLRWALQSMHATLLKKVTTAGHGTRKLDTEHLVGMIIGVPPLTLQDAFEEQVKLAASIIGQHNGSFASMERLFQSLLTRAFRGEV